MDTHYASGASVRLAKTPKLDQDGWLSFTTFLDRCQYSESAELGSVSGAPSMSAATRRSSFSETVLALLFQRPEVSITWGVRTFHFLQALDQRRASNNLLLSRSLYMNVRRWRTSLVIARSWKGEKKKSTWTSTATDEQRFSLLGVVEHASGQQLRSRHCSSQQSRKTRKSSSAWSQRSSQWAGHLTTVRTTPNRRVGGLDDCVHARKSASECVWNLIYRSREARFCETSLRRSLEEVCLPKVIYLNLPATCAGNGSIKVHHC